jgi:thermospermine synthase
MSKWVEEELEPGLRVSYGLKEVLASTKSKWQHVDLVDLQPFGRVLMIDGLVQSCQSDEFVYHESLVHPAMLMHPNPKTVYIGGGGEGSTAREVLRHMSVEKCMMVDIDGDVVDFCRKFLPENTAAFADPRLELIIDDAKAVLENASGFDVIIMDLDDPLEGGPCYQLYSMEFYTMLKAKLNPGGIFVTQSGAAGIKMMEAVFTPVHSTVRHVFPAARAYNQAVYSFMDEWGWNMGFTDAQASKLLTPEEVDARIAERIVGELKFLDGEAYTGLMSLTKRHRQKLAAETRILSTEKGTFAAMHNQGLCVAPDAGPGHNQTTKQ